MTSDDILALAARMSAEAHRLESECRKRAQPLDVPQDQYLVAFGVEELARRAENGEIPSPRRLVSTRSCSAGCGRSTTPPRP